MSAKSVLAVYAELLDKPVPQARWGEAQLGPEDVRWLNSLRGLTDPS